MSCVRPCRLLLTSTPTPIRHNNNNSTRFFSSTRVCTARDDDQDASSLARADALSGNKFAFGELKFESWLQLEAVKWKHPDPLGPKWIGKDVPFPLNPSFQPPTPVSDALRTTIYSAFVANPKANDFRTLSTRYGIAIRRIEAIIRLKELEEQWKKGKQLQTGFLTGMERLLGLHVGGQPTAIEEEMNSKSHLDVAAADEISRETTDEVQDEKKRSITRSFFEPADEGQQPVVSRLLDEERRKYRALEAQRPTYPVTIVRPDPVKPAYKFVDVGLRWVDRTDMVRRAKESIRRRAIKNARKKTDNSEKVAAAAD